MIDQSLMNELKDERDIQRVLSEYCLRLEINDFDQWLDLFTNDAIYEVHRKTLRGRDEIAAVLSLAPHGVHIGGPVRIERDHDTANTVQSYLFIGDEDKFSNNGWYYRTLVRTAQGWKISHTVVKMQKRNKPDKPTP